MLAGLNPTEIREIVPIVHRLCDRGITILMIEHVMQAVMSLSQHVFVLAEGRLIAEGTPARGGRQPRGGRGLSRPRRGYKARGRAWLSDLLDVQGLRAGYGETEVLRGIDLDVGAGEIVAVLGSNGAGKSTLNRTLSGVVVARAGAIRFDGAAIEREKPAAIVARGLIHVPEGRRIFPNLTVSENLDLGSYRRGDRAPRAESRAGLRYLSRACVNG